jgi:prepilin-type N-terminal cleavage/methylation domain-containing protein
MRATSATGKGFTLVELLVVVTILVMLAALFPVAMDRALPGRRVAVTSQRLMAAIRDAQSDSLASGRPVRLELDASAGLTRNARVAVGLPPSTQVRLTDREGRPLRELVVQPDGSVPAARFEVSAGPHRSAVLLSEMSGRVTLEAGSDERQ